VQEEDQPLAHVMPFAYTHQVIDIGGLVPFEIVREVERGLCQQSFRSEVERDHQPAEPAVAIQEGMDRLELVMGYRDPDQRRNTKFLIVQEPLQVGHQVRYMLVVRRHEHSVAQADADPVLAGAELARLFVCAAHTLQQDAVRLAQEPVAERQLFQPADRILDCLDIILDLVPIVALFRIKVIGVLEGVFDARLGPFDAARLGRLFRDIHLDVCHHPGVMDPGRQKAAIFILRLILAGTVVREQHMSAKSQFSDLTAHLRQIPVTPQALNQKTTYFLT